jgi:hypothetical protein
MPWCKGQKKTGGRRKGTPNKTTVSVKTALHEAFAEFGGVPSLVKWAKKNPTEFLKLWVKTMPAEFRGSLDMAQPARLVIVEEIIDAGVPENGDARHEQNGQPQIGG